ncbi:hypothetical protein FRC01_008057 [Tulasnella sp. 417]|nr:hypothetical protein FRC01_008057 [Tulasnella sp. 417]
MSYFESSYRSSSRDDIAVKERFGEACILCGFPDGVDVAEILADSASLGQLQRWSNQLEEFQTDDVENLVCCKPSQAEQTSQRAHSTPSSVCSKHRMEYQLGLFTIVPSPRVRKRMKEHEKQDLKRRQQAFNAGFPDTGRRLLMPPELPSEFEYVPITVPFYQLLHRATRLLPETFLFNSQNARMEKTTSMRRDIVVKEYPLRRWDVSVYAALMAASGTLRNPERIRSVRWDAALREVTELVDLYKLGPKINVQESPRRSDAPDLLADARQYYSIPVPSRGLWTATGSANSRQGSMRFASSSDFITDFEVSQQ